jgi:hypothetical protein
MARKVDREREKTREKRAAGLKQEGYEVSEQVSEYFELRRTKARIRRPRHFCHEPTQNAEKNSTHDY